MNKMKVTKEYFRYFRDNGLIWKDVIKEIAFKFRQSVS